MNKLLFQPHLSEFIDNYTLASIPHSLILLGKEGCGKHIFIDDLATKFQIPSFDLTNNFSTEMFEEIQCKPDVAIYYFDINKMDTRKQNALLKFFEEPLTNAIVILLSTDNRKVINTLLNRGRILSFKNYSKEQLQQFLPNNSLDYSYILAISETPGDIIQYCNDNINIADIQTLCTKIIQKIDSATLPNTLSIIDKIAFENETDKIDFNIFTKILLKTISNYIVNYPDIKYQHIYELTSEFYNESKIFKIDKKQLLQNYLINLKYMKKE